MSENGLVVRTARRAIERAVGSLDILELRLDGGFHLHDIDITLARLSLAAIKAAVEQIELSDERLAPDGVEWRCPFGVDDSGMFLTGMRVGDDDVVQGFGVVADPPEPAELDCDPPWRDWDGWGLSPVAYNYTYQVKFRDGRIVTVVPERPRDFSWVWAFLEPEMYRSHDIVAWRPIPDHFQVEEGEIVPDSVREADEAAVRAVGERFAAPREPELPDWAYTSGDDMRHLARHLLDTIDELTEATESRRHSHYFKSVAGLDEIDVYRVLDLFEVTDPCLQHIIKKALCAGKRGGKDFKQDVREIAATANRRIEMMNEDAAADFMRDDD